MEYYVFSSARSATVNSKSALSKMDSDVNNDAAILEQQHRIEEDIAKNQPLIDEISSLIEFQKDYVDNPRFFSGLDHLLQAYTSIRRVRGDGVPMPKRMSLQNNLILFFVRSAQRHCCFKAFHDSSVFVPSD